MSKDLVVIVLGLWVAAMPFLGFPGLWETAIFVVSGLAIAILMFMIRQSFAHRESKNVNTAPDVYTQNGVDSGIKSRESLRAHDQQET